MRQAEDDQFGIYRANDHGVNEHEEARQCDARNGDNQPQASDIVAGAIGDYFVLSRLLGVLL